MEQVRLAPLVGIVAAIGVILVLAFPYLIIEPANAVETYYGTGAITPLIAGLFALLSIVVFAAGHEERTDPALAAGATLVMSIFAFVIATIWAITVPIDVVTQMDVDASFTYHRFGLVIVALGMPAAAAWFARTLRLL